MRRLLPQNIQLEIAIVRRRVVSRRIQLVDPVDSDISRSASFLIPSFRKSQPCSTVTVTLFLLDDAPPGACVVVARRPRVAICHSRPRAEALNGRANERASTKHYGCVRAYVHACVRACMRANVRTCVRAHANARAAIDERRAPNLGAECSSREARRRFDDGDSMDGNIAVAIVRPFRMVVLTIQPAGSR